MRPTSGPVGNLRQNSSQRKLHFQGSPETLLLFVLSAAVAAVVAAVLSGRRAAQVDILQAIDPNSCPGQKPRYAVSVRLWRRRPGDRLRDTGPPAISRCDRPSLAADTPYTTEYGAAAIRTTDGRAGAGRAEDSGGVPLSPSISERVRFTARSVRMPRAGSRRRPAPTAKPRGTRSEGPPPVSGRGPSDSGSSSPCCVWRPVLMPLPRVRPSALLTVHLRGGLCDRAQSLRATSAGTPCVNACSRVSPRSAVCRPGRYGALRASENSFPQVR